jgi:aspartate ammonia-lyase
MPRINSIKYREPLDVNPDILIVLPEMCYLLYLNDRCINLVTKTGQLLNYTPQYGVEVMSSCSNITIGGKI